MKTLTPEQKDNLRMKIYNERMSSFMEQAPYFSANMVGNIALSRHEKELAPWIKEEDGKKYIPGIDGVVAKVIEMKAAIEDGDVVKVNSMSDQLTRYLNARDPEDSEYLAAHVNSILKQIDNSSRSNEQKNLTKVDFLKENMDKMIIVEEILAQG